MNGLLEPLFPNLKMRQIKKGLIFYLGVGIPVAAPANCDVHLECDTFYDTCEKVKPFPVFPVDGIRSHIMEILILNVLNDKLHFALLLRDGRIEWCNQNA